MLGYMGSPCASHYSNRVVIDTAATVHVPSTNGIKVVTACVGGIFIPYNVVWKFLLITDCKSPLVLCVFVSMMWTCSLERSPLCSRMVFWAGIGNICTNSWYQILSGVLAAMLDIFSSNCCHILFVYSIKVDLEPEEMVVFYTVHFPRFLRRSIHSTCLYYLNSVDKSSSSRGSTIFQFKLFLKNKSLQRHMLVWNEKHYQKNHE